MLTHVRLFLVNDFSSVKCSLVLSLFLEYSQVYSCYHAAEIAWNQKRKEWVGDQSNKAQRPPRVSTIWYMHISDFHPYIHRKIRGPCLVNCNKKEFFIHAFHLSLVDQQKYWCQPNGIIKISMNKIIDLLVNPFHILENECLFTVSLSTIHVHHPFNCLVCQYLSGNFYFSKLVHVANSSSLATTFAFMKMRSQMAPFYFQ